MTRTHKGLSLIGYALAAGLVANWAWAFVNAERAGHVDSDGITLVLKETVTKPDGSTRIGSLRTIAVRADGVMVRRLGPEGQGGRTIVHPSGIVQTTSERTRRVSTIKAPDSGAPHLRRPQADCVSPGEIVEKVGDVRVVRVPADKQTLFYAVDHDCIYVGSRMTFDDGTISETRLESLIAGEPDPDLFSVPADYVEVPPSGLNTFSECSPQCMAQRAAYFKRIDADYEKHRLTQPQSSLR